MLDPITLAPVALALLTLALLTALLLARSLRWAAACHRCAWRARGRSLEHVRAAAERHAADDGHTSQLYHRE